jgi:hypothetical protein
MLKDPESAGRREGLLSMLEDGILMDPASPLSGPNSRKMRSHNPYPTTEKHSSSRPNTSDAVSSAA